jgi:carboxypeptidase PM20D1
LWWAQRRPVNVHGVAEVPQTAQQRFHHRTIAQEVDEGGAVAVGLVPGLDVPAAVVAVAEKGYADFEVTATGEPGHSSSPPRTTAIGILARAITAIEDHPMPATLNTPTGRTFDWMVHEATPTFRVLLANRWLLDPVLIKVMEMRPASNAAVRTVSSVTVVEGGIKDNVLPQSARAVVNCRLITGDTAENVLAHFSKAIGNARVTVRVLTAQAASPAAPPGTFGEQAMQKTLKQTYPDAVFLPNLALGATDARHFAGLTPNIFRFVPIHATSESMKQVHGPAEHLAVEDARNAARYYAQLIVNLCGQ